MNSKDSQQKPSVPSNSSSNLKPKPKVPLPLMTPRNLVPATPMRFNSTGPSSSSSSSSTQPANNSSINHRVIKGPQKSKDKSSIPLPPGYVDRAAQRRSGVKAEPVEVFQLQIQKEEVKTVAIPEKLDFLNENSGTTEFPSCSNESIEKLVKLALGSYRVDCGSTNEFRTNEAFLQFKSIEESKTQPFDPFNRPKKVFRASSRKVESIEADDDSDVLERVREALARLRNTHERNQKYMETLSAIKDEQEASQDIFPGVGRFDEKSALETVINRQNTSTNNNNNHVKSKAKDRLFKSPSSKEPKKQKNESSENVDIFEFIAHKPLEDKKESIEDDFSGGLFGFSNILPKLNRLQDEAKVHNNNGNTLTGVYATILDDDNNEEQVMRKSNVAAEDEDESIYPGYLENDLILGSDDDEDGDVANVKRSDKKKRKLEDKEAAKVEKLVKSKFGVDLTK